MTTILASRNRLKPRRENFLFVDLVVVIVVGLVVVMVVGLVVDIGCFCC